LATEPGRGLFAGRLVASLTGRASEGGGRRMARGTQDRWLFLAASAVVGVAFWWRTDWWAYVGEQRKFLMPLGGQVGGGALVGMLSAGLAIGAARLVNWLMSRRERPSVVAKDGRTDGERGGENA